MEQVVFYGIHVGLLAGALWLAARFPRVFGFFAWEFGVTRLPDEAASAYFLRCAKYWFTVTTIFGLITSLLYRIIDSSGFRYSEEYLAYLAPGLIIWGYCYSVVMYVIHKIKQ